MVHYKSTLAAFALVASAFAAPATIDTPTALIQCQPYKISESSHSVPVSAALQLAEESHATVEIFPSESRRLNAL